jgi:hypothetical protein
MTQRCSPPTVISPPSLSLFTYLLFSLQGFTAVFGVFFVPRPQQLTPLALCASLANLQLGTADVIRRRESSPASLSLGASK